MALRKATQPGQEYASLYPTAPFECGNSAPLGPAVRKRGGSSVQRDCVPQLVEEALRHLFRLAGEAPDFAQQRLLLRIQILRDDDLDDDVLVAAPPASHVRHTPTLKPEGLPVLGAGRDRDLDRS